MARRHPASAALRAALEEQPDLAVLCTHHPAAHRELFGADRMVQLPIAENAMLGMATGMALTGRRVLVNVARAAFLFSAFDPLVNQATKWRYLTDGQFRVPLAIRALTRGGEHLGAQHEHAPHAMLAQVPGLVVAVPGSPNSAAGLLAAALRHPDPVVVLESPALFAPGWESLPEPEPTPAALPFGVPNRVTAGRDVTLVGIGNTVRTVLGAATSLAGHGRAAQVVDLRTAAPLDVALLSELVAATNGAVLVDEAPPACSLMHSLAYQLVAAGAVAPDRVRVVSGAACPAPVNPGLQAVLAPDVPAVVDAALAALGSSTLTKGSV
ncbi:transketolase C-terminal domain-containing protein [Saccharothrix lopnurensis]|uniref:Transketolase C-terminal domain-containing protein n=1 Tax=Saccharothrix lopnurensis TaxID=1670621 RepID=A0ABW1NX20_9PSEU